MPDAAPAIDYRLSPYLHLLLLEGLITLVGGFTDAYAFLAHGHVFANAQTGNVVLFAVLAAQAQWSQALLHLPPILACALGVSTAKLLGATSSKRTYTATLICQTIELGTLLLLCLVGNSLPDHVVVPTLSFVAALQITSFDTLGPWSFNSAMTTGNLKSAVVGLTQWSRGKEPASSRGQAIISGIACVAFFIGALFGAFFTRHHPRVALVPCVVLFAIAYMLTWREHRRGNAVPHPAL